MAFFDNFVHDSRAWFKLSGTDSEEKMHAELKGLVEKRTRAQALNAQPRKTTLLGKADASSLTRFSDGLSDEERRIADEYARTGKIPRMLTSGREPFGVARAGYLRYRKVYGGQDAVLLSSVGDSGQPGASDNDAARRA